MSSRPLVISHANCFDGQASLWVAEQVFGEDGAEYVSFFHGQALPPELGEGRDVYLVDFAFPESDLRDLARRAHRLTVIDHHKSAEAAYTGLLREFNDGQTSKVMVVFDTEACGSMLAWRWWFGDKAPPPELLLRVDDYDRWQFKYDDTKAVIAFLQSIPFDRRVWRSAFEAADVDIAGLAAAGRVVRNFIELRVQEIVRGARPFEILNYTVPLVNAPRCFAGEAANKLAAREGVPFAMAAELTGDHLFVTLRSSAAHGVDVSKIAAQFNGGGHKHAAGFQMPFTVDGIHQAELDDELPLVSGERPPKVLH